MNDTPIATPSDHVERAELMPNPYSARLHALSGSVHDSRRLVAFLFLLMRDYVPFSAVSTPMQEMAGATRRRTEYSADIIDRAARLSDNPTDSLREFIHRINHQLSPEVWATLDSLLPLRDDVETYFSHGWSAAYAVHVADVLTKDEAFQLPLS